MRETQTLEERQRAQRRREREAAYRLQGRGTRAVARAMLSGFEMPEHTRTALETMIFTFLWYDCPGDVSDSLREQLKERKP